MIRSLIFLSDIYTYYGNYLYLLAVRFRIGVLFGWLVQLLDQIAGPTQFTCLFSWSRSMTVLLPTTAWIRSKSFVWSIAEIGTSGCTINCTATRQTMKSNFVIGHKLLLVFASQPCSSSSKELQTTKNADRNVNKEYDRLAHLVSHSVFSFYLLSILSRISIPAGDILLYIQELDIF